MNTAQDIAAYLLASTGGGAQDGEHHAVRQAVIHGVREVLQCRHWLWHQRTGSFTTNQIRTTATITQGSKDIVVASPVGFVPGRIVEVGASHFPTPVRIAAVNGNVVSLDVAASQSASGVTVIPQTYYDLPVDLKDIDTLVTNTVGTLHTYLTPQEWQRLEINTRGAGEPYYYTVMRSDSDPDRYQIRFVGAPVNSTVVHYTYRIIPKPIKYFGYERITRQGSVALAPAGVNNIPTVTGTGTAFPQDCAGAYIRFGADGMEADPAGASFPFVAERRIESWSSKTQLIVSDETIYERPGPMGNVNYDEYDGGVVGGVTPPAPPTGSTNMYTSSLLTLPANTKYAITDVVNASPQMWTAILSACEMWYARIAGKPADAAMQMFNRDLRIAMENDVISPRSGRPHSTPYPTPRSMGWHSELQPDIG
jgi:hypothetical protein